MDGFHTSLYNRLDTHEERTYELLRKFYTNATPEKKQIKNLKRERERT